MVKKGNTLLISLNHGIAARSILQSRLFETLKSLGVKIILLTPNAGDPGFQKLYAGPNVFFETLRLDQYTAFENRFYFPKIFKILRWFSLNGRYDITSIADWYEKVHKKDRKSKKPWARIRYLVEDFTIPILRKSRFLRRLLVQFESLIFSPQYHADVFDKHRPDWVLVTSLGFFDFDQYIMREAKKNKAKIISMILSWDNTSTRGIGGSFPDLVISWTDIMKRELIELHDIEPSRIKVGGAVQFDHYFQNVFVMQRDDFFKQFKLDPNRKTIFFATKSPTGFPWNVYLTEVIAKAMKDGQFAEPCQMIVRLHPIHFRVKDGQLRFQKIIDQYQMIAEKYDNVVINCPTIKTKNIAFDLPKTELNDVSSILKFSDVMVNVFSTMNIEACIYDLPSINASFDEMKLNDQGSARVNVDIDERQTHNQRLIKTGGIKLVRNDRELIHSINQYLENPQLDSEKRMKIVEQECGPYRGAAGAKIANIIFDQINETADMVK